MSVSRVLTFCGQNRRLRTSYRAQAAWHGRPLPDGRFAMTLVDTLAVDRPFTLADIAADPLLPAN
jgi:hypothetical protein